MLRLQGSELQRTDHGVCQRFRRIGVAAAVVSVIIPTPYLLATLSIEIKCPQLSFDSVAYAC